MNIPWLHIWGQGREHSPAQIRGNRLALEQLQAAISAALQGHEGVAKACATDGEGYSVIVQLSNLKSGMGTPPYIYQEVEAMMKYERRWEYQTKSRSPAGIATAGGA